MPVGVDRDAPFARLGIVGLGLVGGSLAAAATAAWPTLRVLGVDRPDVQAEAVRRGWVHEARASVAALGDADIVVLATPVPEIISLLADCSSLTVPVTDVGSTKRAIMQAAGVASLRAFVGGHPMAGSESAGLAHARADLFLGRSWFVVPPVGAPAEAVEWVEALATGVGAVPRRVDAETHDRVMAYVSHLPQLLAVALMNAVGRATGPEGLAMAGRALDEMTRLASSPPDLWQGILASNGDSVAEAVKGLQAALDALDVRRPDSGGLPTEFREAESWRRMLTRVP